MSAATEVFHLERYHYDVKHCLRSRWTGPLGEENHLRIDDDHPEIKYYLTRCVFTTA